MDHIFTGNNWRLISTRLRSRLVLFLIIAVGLIGFSIFEILVGDMTWVVGLVTLVIGAVLGFIYGRIIRVHWDENEEKVVTRLDTVGFIIIAAYIILSFFREELLAHFFSGPSLEAIALALAGGILIGRFFGMHISLMKVIRAHRSIGTS